MDENKVNWKKETDPRKYCFGHSLYRRLVSTVTSYRLRVLDDQEKVDEADKTMSLLSDTMFAGRGGHVEVFEFALGQEVLVQTEQQGSKETRTVQCTVRGQLMMNVDDVQHDTVECYLTDKHGDEWQAPEMMTAIMDESVDAIKDVPNETDPSKV